MRGFANQRRKMKTIAERLAKLYEDARREMREALTRCTEAQQQMFKRMYAKGDLTMTINQCVDALSQDKINQALNQINRTLESNERALELARSTNSTSAKAEELEEIHSSNRE
jgi:HAMP domain-containing protein